MKNLLTATLTHMTVEDAMFEYEALEKISIWTPLTSFNSTDELAVCGDTLAILKGRI